MDKVLHRNSKAFTILKVLIVQYIITGLLIFLLAFLMLKFDLSHQIITAGTIIIYVLSCFLGGILLGKTADQKRFLWGLVMGVIYFIVLLLLTLLFNTVAGIETTRMIYSFFICLFSGMIGGMLS